MMDNLVISLFLLIFTLFLFYYIFGMFDSLI